MVITLNEKLCSSCREYKSILEFHKDKKGFMGCVATCKSCVKDRSRKFYQRNKERINLTHRISYKRNPEIYRAKTAAYRLRETSNGAWVNRLKQVPCMDCHERFPECVMDFDHREPHIKEFTISHRLTCSREKLQAEINKCDVVCANCHRLRTYYRASKVTA